MVQHGRLDNSIGFDGAGRVARSVLFLASHGTNERVYDIRHDYYGWRSVGRKSGSDHESSSLTDDNLLDTLRERA